MATAAQKQYLCARNEVEVSIVKAKNLCEQWLAASGDNPTNLTKKEVDTVGRAFKNQLLTAKWDCEDLEELVGGGNISNTEIDEVKLFIERCRVEISHFMSQLEETDSKSRIFNKHGLTYPSPIQANPIAQSPSSKYEMLSNNDVEEVQFDKNEIVSSATIFNNALYDHIEGAEDKQQFNSSHVFNNLSRPVTNVYMNPNENEMILNMLETEYYNPPNGLQKGSGFNYTIRKLFETDRNRFLGTIAFLFSFPIFLVLFLIV